jgi:putative acetyltransferase
MTEKSKIEVIIRRAKLGDEKGIIEMQKEGLKRKNWIYTGSNSASKKRLNKLRESFKSKSPDSYSFVAIDKTRNKIVGSTIFSFKKKGRIRHRIDLGWGVHPDYQGKGIGTRLLKTALEFAKKKGFKRAEAEMAVKNKSSWKLAKKCGFKIEGIKKKALLTDEGKYVDTYVVGKVF